MSFCAELQMFPIQCIDVSFICFQFVRSRSNFGLCSPFYLGHYHWLFCLTLCIFDRFNRKRHTFLCLYSFSSQLPFVNDGFQRSVYMANTKGGGGSSHVNTLTMASSLSLQCGSSLPLPASGSCPKQQGFPPPLWHPSLPPAASSSLLVVVGAGQRRGTATVTPPPVPVVRHTTLPGTGGHQG